MSSNSKNIKHKQKYKEISTENPFLRSNYIWDAENEIVDKVKTAVLSILLLPLRLIVIHVILLLAWMFAHIGLYGYSKDDLKRKPVRGWRMKLRSVVGFLFRTMFCVGSANWVKIKGKIASSKEAPILVGAPHSSFFDALAVLVSGPASVVGKQEAGEVPFYGKLVDFAQPIYVCRENRNSRAQTIHDILERVEEGNEWQKIDFPPIFIFPEGTCTNRKSLIQFKPGAFLPGQPVQPVLIRYPNRIDTLTWTWSGPNVFVLIWRTLTQFHNFVEIEYLPVYIPNEAELKDPKLYAQNVQKLMAKELDVPVTDYSFDDCKLMTYAENCKMFFAEQIADVSKLRKKIGLASSAIEEYIVKENFKGTEDYFIKFEEFVHRLKIPADNCSYTLFKLFANPKEVSQDVIDFKEYLLHALLLIKMPEPKIEFIKVLFMLYGESGRLQRSPFNRILKNFAKLPSRLIDKLFFSVDSDNRGYITFEDFHRVTQNNPEFKRLYEANRNFRQKTDSR